jgi:hypothetical protein
VDEDPVDENPVGPAASARSQFRRTTRRHGVVIFQSDAVYEIDARGPARTDDVDADDVDADAVDTDAVDTDDVGRGSSVQLDNGSSASGSTVLQILVPTGRKRSAE